MFSIKRRGGLVFFTCGPIGGSFYARPGRTGGLRIIAATACLMLAAFSLGQHMGSAVAGYEVAPGFLDYDSEGDAEGDSLYPGPRQEGDA